VGSLREPEWIQFTEGDKGEPILTNGWEQKREHCKNWVEPTCRMKVEIERRLREKTQWWMFPSPGPLECTDTERRS